MSKSVNTVDEIIAIRTWWYNLGKGYQNIGVLDDVNRRLSALLSYFAELVCDANELKNSSEKLYKSELNKKTYAYEKEISSTAAKNKALVETEELKQAWNDAECYYQNIRLKHESFKDIYDAIKQKISNLKNEKGQNMDGFMKAIELLAENLRK